MDRPPGVQCVSVLLETDDLAFRKSVPLIDQPGVHASGSDTGDEVRVLSAVGNPLASRRIIFRPEGVAGDLYLPLEDAEQSSRAEGVLAPSSDSSSV